MKVSHRNISLFPQYPWYPLHLLRRHSLGPQPLVSDCHRPVLHGSILRGHRVAVLGRGPSGDVHGSGASGEAQVSGHHFLSGRCVRNNVPHVQPVLSCLRFFISKEESKFFSYPYSNLLFFLLFER